MARTLPWLTNSPTGRAQAARPSSSKRQKLPHPASALDPSAKREPPTSPTPRRSRLNGGAARTPSTSPPPQPPSQHSMRPGLDADDIYIMVEDEFLATAQLYTAHLHHAEYHRLKALSHSRIGQSMDISRPVTDTAMRIETRKSKEAEKRAKGIDKGLSSILPKPKAATDATDQSDFEIEQDDPWQGTHLQRFMTVSPQRERALMGLQGMTSRTRAAAGFAAPERASFGTPSRSQSSARLLVKEIQAEDTDEDDDDDDDDLDAPAARTSSRAPSKPLTITSHRETTSIPSKNEKRSPSAPLGNSILQPKPQPKQDKPNPNPQKPPQAPAPKRSFLDMDPLPGPTKPSSSPTPPKPITIKKDPPETRYPHPYPDPHSLAAPSSRTSNPVLRRLKIKREKAERERKMKRELDDGGVTGLDAIPMFLV